MLQCQLADHHFNALVGQRVYQFLRRSLTNTVSSLGFSVERISSDNHDTFKVLAGCSSTCLPSDCAIDSEMVLGECSGGYELVKIKQLDACVTSESQSIVPLIIAGSTLGAFVAMFLLLVAAHRIRAASPRRQHYSVQADVFEP